MSDKQNRTGRSLFIASGTTARSSVAASLRVPTISMWMSNMVQKSDNGSDAVGEAGLRVHANSIDDASFATTLTY